MTETIGVGVVGLGVMGRTHIRAYQAAREAGLPCELVAVCDADPTRLLGHAPAAGNLAALSTPERIFDAERVTGYTSLDAFLADPAVRVVSVCTYTDSHVAVAVKALEAGKHVLVEKPVAVTAEGVRPLAEAAARARTLCMPAMCIRFWPGWDWLAERIADGSLGELRSLTLQRLGSPPGWTGFYGDYTRSGGALIDLHIHDADFIYWTLGMPESVSTSGSLTHCATLYRFGASAKLAAGACVLAEGAWDLAPSAGFRMRFVANFARGTADFDIFRTPNLVLHRPEGSEPIDLPPTTGYDGQVRHLVGAVATGRSSVRATMTHAADVARLLDAERRSIETGAIVRL